MNLKTEAVFENNIIYNFKLSVDIRNNTVFDAISKSSPIGSLRQLPDQKIIFTNKTNVGQVFQFKDGFIHNKYWHLFNETKVYIICPGIEVIDNSVPYFELNTKHFFDCGQ